MPPSGSGPRFRVQLYRYSIIAFGFITLAYYYLFHQSASSTRSFAQKAAANSTLGFQKILVLSKGPGWRTRGLEVAAAHTGLDIEIPVQSVPTPEFVQMFRDLGPKDGKHPGLGQAYNWIAHYELVRYAIALDLDTFLILEDDVDWDVSVKHQMQLLSSAVREFTFVDEKDRTPYGRSWDILWIGHSGEPIENNTRRLVYEDRSAPVAAEYTGWAKRYFPNTERVRALQRGVNPVGTVGYALTKRGAKKIMMWAGKGENEAYDIRLMEGCKKKELSCLVVAPELMNHYIPPKDFGHVSEVAGANGGGSKAEEEDFEKLMGSTPNILQSTRCRVLFGSTCLKI